MLSKNMVNVNKAVNTGVNNIKEEMKMKNINNDGVNVNEVVNIGVNNNNKEGEMKMVVNKGVNNDGAVNNGVNKEEEMKMVNKVKVLGLGIVGVDTAVEKYNSGKYTGAITVDFMGDSLFVEFREMVMGVYYVNPGVVELLRTDDTVVIETSVVELKARVAAHILAVRESGLGYEEYAEEILNKDRWIYGRGYELLELFSKQLDSYTKEESYMVDIKDVQAITLEDHRLINESQLWETIGEPRYTLPLIYVIENVIGSMVENQDLDEEVMNHTNEIIMGLVNKGEFLYVIEDGELQEVEGISTEGIEAVEVFIPYLLELEKAADELWGFTRVVDNLDLSDDVKDEMMMQVFGDELYSFVHQYCREVWWDGGSN